ncbi:hypothetical protein ACFYTG_32275 [Streptomyces mirabilis]|uniref:hypothetical protein n=1 Tax=Streptomyces mirabilis TaxID=68239 RepID=UPI00368444F8
MNSRAAPQPGTGSPEAADTPNSALVVASASNPSPAQSKPATRLRAWVGGSR